MDYDKSNKDFLLSRAHKFEVEYNNEYNPDGITLQLEN